MWTALLLLHERQIDPINEIAQFRDAHRLRRVSIQRVQFAVSKVSNACLGLVLRIHGRKALSSLDGFDFPANAHALAVSKNPPTAMSHNVAGLLGSSHIVSFRFVFGLPAEALPPSAAIRFRSLALSFWLRASPAFRAISERRSGLNFSVLALPPSFPRARACGFFFFMPTH